MYRNNIYVRIRKSRVKKGGRARICRSAFNELSLSQGGSVIVENRDRHILVNIFTDPLVEEGQIYLREDDLRRLGAGEGEEIKISLQGSVEPSTHLGIRDGKVV